MNENYAKRKRNHDWIESETKKMIFFVYLIFNI